MSDIYGNDEFEKVDADQDENVTSTSMTDDMAEEEAYREHRNDADLLGDFLDGHTPSNEKATSGGDSEPLMTFGTSEESPVADMGDSVSGASTEKGCWMKEVDPRVLDLIYWRDVKKTGVVFGSMVLVLLSLAFFTILSVLAYLSLAILTVTMSFRVYRNVMQAVQKTKEGHPFKKLLDMDIALKEEVVSEAAEKIAANVNNCSQELRRLFLVEDYVDSLKFGLLLWLMTYIGSWFNGMTLVILAVVCIFTLPKVYETYQGPIDQNINLIRTQLNNIMAQVSAKIPFPKKKVKAQ